MTVSIQGTGKRLTSGDIGKAAKSIGISTPVLLSFLEVEAAGRGFDNQNRIKILPEGHIFYRYLSGSTRDKAVSMGIAFARWRAGAYNFDKYVRFLKMVGLNRVAAYLSISSGLGQIMGFNHKEAGFGSAEEMFNDALKGEFEQLIQVVTLMKSWNMHTMLQGKDFSDPNSWRPAAKKYNGKSYAKHGYHTKLARAHRKHSTGKAEYKYTSRTPVALKRGMKSELVRALQSDLQVLGYEFKDGLDGRFGPETERHVKNFQHMNDLLSDGKVGKKTKAKLTGAVSAAKIDKSPEMPVFDKQGGLLAMIAQIIQGFLK